MAKLEAMIKEAEEKAGVRRGFGRNHGGNRDGFDHKQRYSREVCGLGGVFKYMSLCEGIYMWLY